MTNTPGLIRSALAATALTAFAAASFKPTLSAIATTAAQIGLLF